jgi:hypothetical protein
MVAITVAALLVLGSGIICPNGMVAVESFSAEDRQWTACEDLSSPGGGLVLVPNMANGNDGSSSSVWLSKTYEPYSQGPDSEYYLGLGKQTVLDAKWDMLNDAVMNICKHKTLTTGLCEPSWTRVERALPVMRYSFGNKKASGNEFMCSPYSPESGVRTFTGSRSASVDATFSDHADDCTDNGFPRPQGYVMNLTAIAAGEPPIHDFLKYVNFSGMADGLVGGEHGYPHLIFYFPILPQNFSTFGGSRYWTMIASPVPDMEGGREQSVWFRFQQIKCIGARLAPPCTLLGKPQYYDTYWFSFSPITTRWIRPELMANASGFYSNLLRVKRYWDATLAAEGLAEVQLPVSDSTNGTWLQQQALFSLVRSMISRDDTWHPRYGVLPGYGVTLQDGFQDTFTSTAMAALEWGAFPYAAGVIDNWLTYYVRDNGMITYRAEELAQSGRMLTIFALYVSYTGDEALMVKHFAKIRAVGKWLIYRLSLSKETFPDPSDPRHGIIAGQDEGDTFRFFLETHGSQHLAHYYSNQGNVYRGFLEAGQMWKEVGEATKRPDMIAHAKELMDAAPGMLSSLHASLAKTTRPTGNPRAPNCVPTRADPPTSDAVLSALAESISTVVVGQPSDTCLGDFRGYPELMYAAVLTRSQTEDLFLHLTYGNNSMLSTRPMTLTVTGYGGGTPKPTALPSWMATYVAYGMGFGLLAHDMVERFLLHYFSMSAHTYTRGTWTTPEGTMPDRDAGSTDYVAAGVHTAPTYLKWLLVFEEPNNKTLWLAKATPRSWLAPDMEPIVVRRMTTRYGRVSYTLTATITPPGAAGASAPCYRVHANVSLPSTFLSNAPPGGLRLRLRAPTELAGKLSAVSVGGKPWQAFNPTRETVDFAPSQLSQTVTLAGMRDIVAEWSGVCHSCKAPGR